MVKKRQKMHCRQRAIPIFASGKGNCCLPHHNNNNNNNKNTTMETTKSSTNEDSRSKKSGVMKKIRHYAKFFVYSYTQYLKTGETSFYSTWYGHPYGMR
jgi:hypothetical protein